MHSIAYNTILGLQPRATADSSARGLNLIIWESGETVERLWRGWWMCWQLSWATMMQCWDWLGMSPPAVPPSYQHQNLLWITRCSLLGARHWILAGAGSDKSCKISKLQVVRLLCAHCLLLVVQSTKNTGMIFIIKIHLTLLYWQLPRTSLLSDQNYEITHESCHDFGIPAHCIIFSKYQNRWISHGIPSFSVSTFIIMY